MRRRKEKRREETTREEKKRDKKKREDGSRVTGAIIDRSRESWLCWLCDACAQLMTSLCLNLLSRCVYSHHTLPRVSKSCYVQEFLLHSGVCILGWLFTVYEDNLGLVGTLLCQASSLKYTLSQQPMHTSEIYSRNTGFSLLWCLSCSRHWPVCIDSFSVSRRGNKMTVALLLWQKMYRDKMSK